MSLRVLARRNALDPYRSRSLWILLSLFALVFGLVGYLIDTEFTPLWTTVTSIIVVLGPLAALAFTYDAIAGPRESGALRVLLSYPYTRREVVLGTFVGRVAVISLAVVVGVVAVLATALVFGSGDIALGAMAIVLALALVLTTAMVAVAIGISASTSTSTRAVVVAFGAYLLFSGFWRLVPSLFRYVLNGLSAPGGSAPDWVLVWRQLNPFNAFRSATQALTEAPLSEGFYHAPWFGIGVLLAWIVLPVVVGLVTFERADL